MTEVFAGQGHGERASVRTGTPVEGDIPARVLVAADQPTRGKTQPHKRDRRNGREYHNREPVKELRTCPYHRTRQASLKKGEQEAYLWAQKKIDVIINAKIRSQMNVYN